MSDTTTTGNINAKVSLTATEFFAEAKRVQAKAAELGALNPEIKVDANVAEALAKLEALNRRVTDSREKDAQATARQESVVRRFTDALDQNSGSGRRGNAWMQTLVTLSPAIVGAIAPIGAAATHVLCA